MMGELIARNLLHRPLRTIIGAMGIAVEVALVVLIVGLTSGLLTETAKRIEGIGADIMLQPPNSSFLLSFGSAPMPIKIGEKLGELKYVEFVAPVLFQFNTSGVEIVYGIDQESFRDVSGGFVFLEGHDLEGPDDILVDDIAAKAKKIKPGETYRIFDHDWHVAGIVEHGKGSRLFVSRATLQELVGARDQGQRLLCEVHAPRAHRGRHGKYAPRPSRLHRPASQGLSLPDDLNKYPRVGVLYQRHDPSGRHDRSAGHFSHHVHHGDRTHQGHRRSEIARRESLVRYSSATLGIRSALFARNCRWRRVELRRARGIRLEVSDANHSHHLRMGSTRRRNRALGRVVRRQLSGVAGEPQRCR